MELVMGEENCTQTFLAGKIEGKRPLGRPRHSRQDNITIDLKEIGWAEVG
jgi:hypothetical protein